MGAFMRNPLCSDPDKWNKDKKAGKVIISNSKRRVQFSYLPSGRNGISVTTRGCTFEDEDPAYYGSKVKFRVKTLNVTLDDGFLWFKNGEKKILEHKHPRSYLKCIESAGTGCRVLKRVQSSREGENSGSSDGGNLAATNPNKTEIYRKIDRLAWKKNGRAGGIKTRKQARRNGISVTTRGCTFEDEDPAYYGSKVKFRVKTLNVTLDDGFLWFKNGEKKILEHKHPRSYLKCIESAGTGCRVLKRVQRCSSNEDYVEFLYLGLHNHRPQSGVEV
ncbi:hypothetical protein L7F22_053561 [Adiantum nelumboides]|nr:hypothetical protein [Adiantum nelumboides]